MGGKAGNMGGIGNRPGVGNWKPPGGFGRGAVPPQTGGPLPPFGAEPGPGFNNPNMNFGPRPPGRNDYNGPATPGNWMPPGGGMVPGGERPGTYEVGGPQRITAGPMGPPSWADPRIGANPQALTQGNPGMGAGMGVNGPVRNGPALLANLFRRGR